LTFGGRPTVTVPVGASMTSDPVALALPAFADVAVDIFVPGDTVMLRTPVTYHATGLQTNYLSITGNYSGVAAFPVDGTAASWYLLSRIEVMAPASTGAVVTLGDSITDGSRSTANTNNRWPDLLARRLAAASGPRLAVLNAGIGGNRLLLDGTAQNALARFDRDVLAQPGVTHVVVLEGINDIGSGRGNPLPSAADLIGAHRQLIARAHDHGLKIIGATLTPFDGDGYFTPAGEAKRVALNDWIRTSKEYDGVIDFDLATRDPAQPSKFLPAYQSGDWLHPNDAGFQAMVQAIEVSLFGVKAKK
jgi:lysophospholipase L1-like esterase